VGRRAHRPQAQDAVQRAVDVGPHLRRVVLEQVCEDAQGARGVACATLLARSAQAQIHQQRNRVLDRVLAQLPVPANLANKPLDHVCAGVWVGAGVRVRLIVCVRVNVSGGQGRNEAHPSQS
jgi:hypothetical protein